MTISLGPLYTRSQSQKNLGPALSTFGLQIGLPNLTVSFFFSLGANTRPQNSAFSSSNLGQIEKFLLVSALTPSVKPLGLISTFAPIGMLDLG
jgi:hypothetical protein